MKKFCRYGLRGVVFTRSYYVTLMYKIVKVPYITPLWNQNGSIAGSTTYLHFITIANNPIKYEQIPLYGYRGEAFTKCKGRTNRDNYYALRRGATEDKSE